MACLRFVSGHAVGVAVALVLIVGQSAQVCDAAKEYIYDTWTSEADGGGFGNKWRDISTGETVMPDYENSLVGDDGAAGMYSMKVDFNSCPWRWWAVFSLHSVQPFVTDENTHLFFRWAGNARAFTALSIVLESASDGTTSSVSPSVSSINVPGNTDDLNKPWYISVPFAQFKGLTTNNEWDRLAFRVVYKDHHADEQVEWYMSDIFIGTTAEGDDNTPQAPMDTRNYNMFNIVSKEYIYDGTTAVAPYYVSPGWRDWSWGALMPREWNQQWKTNNDWVKCVVNVVCDGAADQAFMLKSSPGIKVDDGTILHFKYSGDWRDVELQLSNSQDDSMDVSIALAEYVSEPTSTTDGEGEPVPVFRHAAIPLASVANSKKYDIIKFVHTEPVSDDRPLCYTFGSTPVHCQSIYLADVYTE